MLPDKIEHRIVFMNSWDVSGGFWSFLKCNLTIPHLPADPPSILDTKMGPHTAYRYRSRTRYIAKAHAR